MLPVGMKFFTQRKLLSDPPKQRDNPFPHKCKLCDVVGHEAYECANANFQVDGKPGKSYRELFRRGIVNQNGVYQ